MAAFKKVIEVEKLITKAGTIYAKFFTIEKNDLSDY
jgi:hypothetical protein